MKALAWAIVVALALACVLREACRRALRVAIVALRGGRRAVERFAYDHVTSPVVWEVEPEPTVCERLQWLLAADDIQRERERVLWAQLHERMAGNDAKQAELDEIIARQAAEQAEQERIAAITSAIRTCLAWRTYSGGLGVAATYTPAAGSN